MSIVDYSGGERGTRTAYIEVHTQPGSSQRMSFGFQAPTRVDDVFATIGVVTPLDHLVRFTELA